MTFLIAAAGTGGHVYPGLSVGEGLLDLGVARDDILYVGGDRLEARVYPAEGFRFLQVELTGLKRSLNLENARLPGVVARARRRIAEEIDRARIRVVLGMGGYVTVPTALAARKTGVAFYNAEQNAEAGLANRLTARWARRSFVSFPETGGLPEGEWVGNPVRQMFWDFDRAALRPLALERFGLEEGVPVIGVFGGSLGAGVINEAVAAALADWDGPTVQVVHLTGTAHLETMESRSSASSVIWRRLGFEERMDLFYAASDIVVARAGGAVAEITATATPSVLIPGRFGSGGHQVGNAGFLERSRAAIVIPEETVSELAPVLAGLLDDPGRCASMATAASGISKPDAARTIARVMIEATS